MEQELQCTWLQTEAQQTNLYGKQETNQMFNGEQTYDASLEEFLEEMPCTTNMRRKGQRKENVIYQSWLEKLTKKFSTGHIRNYPGTIVNIVWATFG